MKTKITKIITLMFIILNSFCYGQQEHYIQYVRQYITEPNHHGFFYYETPNEFTPGEIYQKYKFDYSDYDNSMVLIEHHLDSSINTKHYEYQQLYKNIPVEAAGCVEHFNNQGSLTMINAKLANNIDKSPTPLLTDNDAVVALIDSLEFRYESNGFYVKFAWQDSTLESQLQNDNNDTTATWYPKAKLIWAINNLKDLGLIISGNRYTLAYKISLTIILPQPKQSYIM